MSIIFYSAEDCAQYLAASYTAYFAGFHYSEDGRGVRINESRAFSMAQQTERGYAANMREPFRSEAYAEMHADCDE
jgi:hypothetical protein